MEAVGDACPSCGRAYTTPKITTKEMRVLDLLSKGRGNPEIAESLGVSVAAIKHCIGRLVYKLQIPAEHCHPRIRLAYLWSCPIFRIGAGCEVPVPTLRFAIDREFSGMLREEEKRRELADPAD